MSRHARASAIAALIGAGLALSACSSSSSPPPAAVEPAITTQPMAPLPTGALTAPDITRALAERKFNFSSGGRSGTVTYFKDGTFEYDEKGKGVGTGIWQAANGKLCEARNPTSFLPKGTPSTCSPISSDGTRFTVGAMQLIPVT